MEMLMNELNFGEREREERRGINERMGVQTQGHVFTCIHIIVLSGAIKQSWKNSHH